MTNKESQKTAHAKRKVPLCAKNVCAYPALVGRQVYCGLRQSTPSSKQANCELVSDTVPSFADGQMKRPFSSRLA